MSKKSHNAIAMQGLRTGDGVHKMPRIAMLGKLKRVGLIFFGVLLLGSVGIVGLRLLQSNALAQAMRENSKLFVFFVNPKPGNPSKKLLLPGTIQGFAETPIYARTSGYVQKWYKDIGDHVQKGDLLAQIDTPEVMQQLAEAKATRAQTEANLQLAKSSFERWKALRQRDAVSQQELDERTNTYNLGRANLEASEANVQRLTQLLSYNKVTAPFAGLITKRNVDVGNLVDAGNGGAPKALFSISQIDPLRLYVQVPQAYSPDVQPGIEAQVSLAEMPGKKFKGRVVRTSGAIDPVSRTLQIEVNIPNSDNKILPGSFATVELQTKERAEVSTWTLPNNAVLFRPEGTMVAVVNDQGIVALKKITIGRDLGVSLVVTSGLELADKVIVNPPDSLTSGDTVVAKLLPAKSADEKKADAKSPVQGGGAAAAKSDSKSDTKVDSKTDSKQDVKQEPKSSGSSSSVRSPS
jgi:RND family efflux transporter MFP subunit